METRKIQSVGGGTYTVSIPKEWANDQGITTGDTVEVHRHIDGILAVQASECAETAPSRITVQLTQSETVAIERTIRAAYAAGTKAVRLENPEGFTDEQRRVLTQVTRTLTGVSVTEDSERMITVETLLDTDEVSVRQTVRQLRFVVLSMHREAFGAITDETATLDGRDDQADRLHAMLSRSFSRAIRRLDEVDALGLSRSQLFDCWATTRELERIGDHAVRLVTEAGEELDQVPDALDSVAELARELVSAAVDVVVGDADAETAQRALANRDELREEIDEIEAEHDPELQLRMRPVFEMLRRTVEHGGAIAEIGLKQAIRSGELASLSESEELPS